MRAERVRSWAEITDEVEQRHAHASRLVDLELASAPYADSRGSRPTLRLNPGCGLDRPEHGQKGWTLSDFRYRKSV